MAKRQENSTTTLLGLKDWKAGNVVRDDDRVIMKITITRGKQLVRSRSRRTRQAETEALWQLRDRNFSKELLKQDSWR